EEHQDTLSLMEYVKYDFAYMFAYSERPGTLAHKKFADDVPEEVKKRRLNEIIDLQQKHSLERNQKAVGKIHKVLIEGPSKRSEEYLKGRNSQNTVVIFPKKNYKKGDYVNVLVKECTPATLFGEVVD
ncbi:MAG TPA: TRAM domain-containing protein, partial [Cytophagaceae bacterium]